MFFNGLKFIKKRFKKRLKKRFVRLKRGCKFAPANGNSVSLSSLRFLFVSIFSLVVKGIIKVFYFSKNFNLFQFLLGF